VFGSFISNQQPQTKGKTMQTTAAAPENVTLYYREGSSDKVYQVQIEQQGDGFLVNFAYGRRGSTLNTGSKTSSPVPYEQAKRIFDKQVKEKQAKGYTAGESGTPYHHTAKEAQATGIHCQLLNPIEEHDVRTFINHPEYMAQEKYDGKRLLIKKEGTTVIGINRRGLEVGLPESLVSAAEAIPGDFIMDGESVGNIFYAFDLLAHGYVDIRPLDYRDRFGALVNLVAGMHPSIELAHTAFEPDQKLFMLAKLKKEDKEGIVFKYIHAPYTAGRPNTGGPQVKHKFYATLSAVVSQINQQRSVELELYSERGWVKAGNVTIPPNQPIPAPGSIVEIRYLYAFKESGCLYQPTFLGIRTDLIGPDCTVNQLKYKPNTEMEEA
jgi:bifunctional non-homologous end joining protein LigD